MTNYAEFLQLKSQGDRHAGFTPTYLPDVLIDFQRHLVEWAVCKGRAAIFADCGLGKSLLQLVWAENVIRHTNKPVLLLAPLAVSHQFIREGERFGIEVHRSDDGKPKRNVTVTNYERLDKFNPDDYGGVACDEISIIKHWTGATQKSVTRFLSKMPYRLGCTATPAPNDYIEMGTLSEALGELTYSDMLATFFRQISDDEKKKRASPDDITHSKRLSWRVMQSFGQWALKAHAFEPFWKWVASWGRACRKPSDLGPFSDERFTLPPLHRREHIVEPRTPTPGHLFNVPAFGLNQERAERRRTMDERGGTQRSPRLGYRVETGVLPAGDHQPERVTQGNREDREAADPPRRDRGLKASRRQENADEWEWACDREKGVLVAEGSRVSAWNRNDGQPPPRALRVLEMAGKGGNMNDWPEDLRVREMPA